MPLAKDNRCAICRDSSLNRTSIHPPYGARNSRLFFVYLPRRAENFGVKSLYRDISTVDMGGEGGSQKKCDLRDFFAELWFEKLDEMSNNQG